MAAAAGGREEEIIRGCWRISARPFALDLALSIAGQHRRAARLLHDRRYRPFQFGGIMSPRRGLRREVRRGSACSLFRVAG